MISSHQVYHYLGKVSGRLHGLRGRGWLAGHLFRKQLHHFQQKQEYHSQDWEIRMADGSRLLAPSSSSQTWQALFTGRYDGQMIPFISQFAKPKTTILDVGACLGFYSIGLAMQNPQSNIIAFEPSPHNTPYLKKNIEKNHLEKRVRFFEYGLGKESSQQQISSAEMGAGNSFVIENGQKPNFATSLSDIKIEPLDYFLPKITNPCELVKIDVEGFEMNVLLGAKNFIEQHRPIIFGEFSLFWMKHYGFDPLESVLDWSEAHQFNTFEISEHRVSRLSENRKYSLTKVDSSTVRSGASLILIPQEKS